MRNYNKFVLDSNNLKCNLTIIKRLLKDKVKLCAVVKANGYGVGVDSLCSIIDKYVDYYAVSSIQEAKEIRDLGYSTKILVLGETPIENIEYCSNNNISISVGNIEYLKAICENLHSSLNIHIKINTGLNRYGIKSLSEFKKMLRIVDKSKKIKLEGIFTHFATKGDDIEFINIQKHIFDEYCSLVPKGVIRHCANSYATILSSIYQMDMVRIGINMFGDLRDEKLPLKTVLSIKSEIVAINTVFKNQTIGYEKTFVAPKRLKIAVVPIGYADGVRREVGNKFYVLVNGKKANIVGNVCMDCFMIDITNIKNVYIGTEVTIVGRCYDEELKLQDWAKIYKTSVYEALIGFKVKRFQTIIK